MLTTQALSVPVTMSSPSRRFGRTWSRSRRSSAPMSTASNWLRSRRMDAQHRPPARRADTWHARGLHQLAQQSDRLDTRPRTTNERSSIIAAGTARGSLPTMPTSGCTTRTAMAPLRLVPRSCRSGRSRCQHEHVLEVVADDRLASRLDRRAGSRSSTSSGSCSNTTRRARRCSSSALASSR